MMIFMELKKVILTMLERVLYLLKIIIIIIPIIFKIKDLQLLHIIKQQFN